jgi:hypothetical protein
MKWIVELAKALSAFAPADQSLRVNIVADIIILAAFATFVAAIVAIEGLSRERLFLQFLSFLIVVAAVIFCFSSHKDS